VTAAHIDLSFLRYVAARKGLAAARVREGAAYAYSGDLRVRNGLDRLRPVTLAVAATERMWQTGKARLLEAAVEVGPSKFPHVHKAGARCAQVLQIPVPAIYISPSIGVLDAHTFGTADEPCIVLHTSLIDRFSDAELLAVIGHECGHIHNNHAVYLTTRYFLGNAGNQFLRWVAKPAVAALDGWVRRAEITCDRAALLCTGDMDVSTAVLVKLDELLARKTNLSKRVAALGLFAETAYFRGVLGKSGGTSKATCDAKVGKLLAVQS